MFTLPEARRQKNCALSHEAVRIQRPLTKSKFRSAIKKREIRFSALRGDSEGEPKTFIGCPEPPGPRFALKVPDYARKESRILTSGCVPPTAGLIPKSKERACIFGETPGWTGIPSRSTNLLKKRSIIQREADPVVRGQQVVRADGQSDILFRLQVAVCKHYFQSL